MTARSKMPFTIFKYGLVIRLFVSLSYCILLAPTISEASTTIDGEEINLEDDFFYFTSFAEVEQWPKVYKTCDINFDFQYNRAEINEQDLKIPAEADPYVPPEPEKEIYSFEASNIPHNLSPISITFSETTSLNKSLDADGKREKVLKIYNPPAPKLGLYSVSFGFQKNKECITANAFSPCYLSQSFGKARGVVLTAERPSLRKIREEFTVEEPDQFPSILGGNGDERTERRFYEAIFMGTTEKLDCKGSRSTHVIDGKCYPMEIYLYFVDETIPTMASTTILVVLVEEAEHENQQVRPVSNAVTLHLYEQERAFLRQYRDHIAYERSYHHMGESAIVREKLGHKFTIPSSLQVEQIQSEILDHLERIQAYKISNHFANEEFNTLNKILHDLSRKRTISYKGTEASAKAKIAIISQMYDMAENKEQQFYYDNRDNYPHIPPITVVPVVDSLDSANAKTDVLKKAIGDFLVDAIIDKILNQEGEYTERFQIEQLNFIRKTLSLIDKAWEDLMTYSWEYIGETPTPEEDDDFKNLILKSWQNGVQSVRIPFEKTSGGGAKLETNYIEYGFPSTDATDPANIKNLSFSSLFQDDFVESEMRAILDEHGQRDHPLIYHKLKKTGPPKYAFPESAQPPEPGIDPPERPGPWFFTGNLGMSEEKFEAYEKLSPQKFFLKNNFQVSWLFPQGGGYFRYKGSSPVPPCFAAEQVIVFRKPIKMSREQIEALTVVPTSNMKTRDIINTLGVRQPRRVSNNIHANTVYFDRRNHQFLGDDGFHKNSILEFEKRKKGSAGNLSGNLVMLGFILMSNFLII